MIIYIDSDYKCHTDNADGRMAVDVPAFDGKCKIFIEGYRFIPSGYQWTRKDGVTFYGEVMSPWENFRVLEAAQKQYESSLAEIQDMRAALSLLDVVPIDDGVINNGST